MNIIIIRYKREISMSDVVVQIYTLLWLKTKVEMMQEGQIL